MPQRKASPAASSAYSYAELGSRQAHQAALAEECALAISYNDLNQAVMMVSPHHLEDFAIGFSLGNGLISSIDDIYDISIRGLAESREARLEVSSRCFWAIKQQRRQMAGSSGCGLCGVDALEQALPKLQALPGAPLPPLAHLQGLRERIGEQQQLARNSGALHAALFIDGQGEIRLCREDIGRHNALDKLIGALARQRIDTATGFALVTSRCSLELLHKAVRAGLGTLVSLSAPTALTVEWARRHRLNLIHLPHHSTPRVYSPAPVPEESA
ncbi:formate dehydrogenase accessory sulfurtransferase FdhD [Pseudomonas sp. GOM7]|uniref:formate dehydrogenase accessory sulfurtransferase FdhD n=1 Tax=unclassified Pseudomonas TaxID=196821 RepID=UPI00227A9887|nr:MULTISPECIES: formate dehydrogenase accessory sulfurtransferase FdhD [unclassified Pseudomonas]WAJ37366.1 formate dehydrogenase accessory sulfurtransferase FdhD [Pseudomonas sp. GOM7]